MSIYANAQKLALVEQKITENANMITANLKALSGLDPNSIRALEARLAAAEGNININAAGISTNTVGTRQNAYNINTNMVAISALQTSGSGNPEDTAWGR